MYKTKCNRIIAIFMAIIFIFDITIFDINSNTTIYAVEKNIASDTDSISGLENKTLDSATVKKLWASAMDDLGWITVNDTTGTLKTDDNGKVASSIKNTMWETTKVENLDPLSFNGNSNKESFNAEIDASLIYTLKYDYVLNGYYKEYEVYNANQLIIVLYLYSTMDVPSVASDDDDEEELETTTTVKNLPNNKALSKEPTIGDSSEDTAEVSGSVKMFKSADDKSSLTSVAKLGIVLEKDIDLNHSTSWKNYSNTNVILEINGNGYTIYNGYFYGSKYFIGAGDQKFYIHDLTFSNMLITHNQGMFGSNVQWAYFNNVNFTKCIAVNSNVSTTIVLGTNYLDCYFKECTISNCYVFGNGHCSTFATYNEIENDTFNCTYEGDTIDDITSYYYTYIPTAFVDIEKAWQGQDSLSTHFPSIYEDCASVDCYIYDTDIHSGTFVSCIRSGVIFKRCFSNSTIMAQNKTGVFLGAVIGASDGFYYPVDGNSTLVSAYFEDCYTSGLVEGNSEIGGFIGTVFNDLKSVNRAYFKDKKQGNTSKGKVVFNNCYSTSLVGLEYSGTAIGGFVGSVRGSGQSDGTDNIGKRTTVFTDKTHLFKNCYAAGEVGDIATDVSKSNTNNAIGGFMGTYDTMYNGFDIVNCYYDKQTTGMRERVVGASASNWACYGFGENNNTKNQRDQAFMEAYKIGNDTDTAEHGTLYLGFGNNLIQLDLNDRIKLDSNGKKTGEKYSADITGVYTLASEIKGVQGLAYTEGTELNVDMGSDNWTYKDGYYPMIDSLLNFKSSCNTEDNGNIESMAKAREELYRKCSLASASTVYLDHYDTVMDDNGDTQQANEITEYTYKNVYDTVRDITSTFEFTSHGNADVTGISTSWYLNNTMNKSHSYTGTFGLPFTSTETNSNYTDTIDNGITYQKNVAVLTITPSSLANGEYIYKCTSFAPGKQWVTVYVTDDNYNTWANKETAYNLYQKEAKKYRRILQGYALMISEDSQETDNLYDDLKYKQTVLDDIYTGLGLDDNSTTTENEVNSNLTAIKSRLKGCLTTLDTNINNATDSTEKSNLETIKQYLTTNGVTSTNIDSSSTTATIIYGYCKTYLDIMFEYVIKDINLSSATKKLLGDVTQTHFEKTNYLTLVTDGDSIDVEEPLEFDSENYENKKTDDNEIVCTRSLRLLPKDYIDAGSDMEIEIKENDKKNCVSTSDTTKDYTNTFTILDIDGNGKQKSYESFRHDLTVSYAATSNDRLGKYNTSTKSLDSTLREQYSIYGQQLICNFDDVVSKIGQSYSNKITTDPETIIYPFAVKESFKSLASVGTDDNPYTIDKLTNMNMSIGNTSSSQTIVKVYKSNIQNGKISIGDEITEERELNEWKSGSFVGNNEDGYYFMVYYWKLNDGRFLSDSKLVQISNSSYEVSMTSGILGADEEPTTTANINGTDVNQATIDINVDKDKTTAVNSFPSENGYSSNNYVHGTCTLGNYTYTDDRYTESDGSYYITNLNDGQQYLAKSVVLSTSEENMTVAWKRNADYIMKTLTVEVYAKNVTTGKMEWQNMASVTYNTDGSYIFNRATLSYGFTSIEYIYDKDEDIYMEVETPGVMKEYVVDTSIDDGGSVVSSIDLDFSSVGSGTNTDNSRKIRCTAYFVNVSANVTADKYILIDDGQIDPFSTADASKYEGTNKGVINVEKYREVDDYQNNEDVALEDQKAVMSGDTLIFRTYLHNDGYYTAQTTNLYETLPSGVHLVDDSIRIYRQYKDTTGVYKYGDVQLYSNGEDIVQYKDLAVDSENIVTNAEDNTDFNTYRVTSTYSITETIEDGYHVGRYKLTDLRVVDEYGNEKYYATGNNIDVKDEIFQNYNNGDPTGYNTDNPSGEKLYSYKVYQDDSGNVKIDWKLEYVASDYDYFLEYKAIVDDIGVETTTAQSYESSTEFDNVFLNGDTLYEESLGHLNSNYKASSIMTLEESDSIYGVGVADPKKENQITYTVKVNINNKNKYNTYLNDNGLHLEDTYFAIDLDNGFEFDSLEMYVRDSKEKITLKTNDNTSSNGKYSLKTYTDSNDKITKIEVHGLDVQNESYTFNLLGYQTDITDGVNNKFVLMYQEVKFEKVDTTKVTAPTSGTDYYILDNTNDTYTLISNSLTEFGNDTTYYIKTTSLKENAVTYYADVTNTVETKATWTYLNIKKVITEKDDNQTFIFKVQRYDTKDSTTPTDTFYVDVRCTTPITTNGETTGYFGEQPIVLGKRGYYTVTEVTNWSSTDYTDLPTVKVPTSPIIVNVSNSTATVSLPIGLLDSTAFKLGNIYTESENDFVLDYDKIPTVTFTNTKKNQVWKTAQSFAKNIISLFEIS